MTFDQKLIDNFFKNTILKDNGCLEWTSYLSLNKYGRFMTREKLYLAHKFAWLIQYGPVPKGLIICHSCDNTKCVNYKHLWLGTHLLNARDRALKKRGRKRMFSNDQEKEIARFFFEENITAKELSKTYSTTRENISSIVSQSHFREKYGNKSNSRPKKITEEIRNEILKKHAQGESLTSLAKQFSITRGAVLWHIDRDKKRAHHNNLQRIRRAKLALKQSDSSI